MLANLNDVLLKAQKEGYAVGLFNTTDTDMLEAAISAAEEMNSPIIIGTAEVLLPYGELDLIAPSIVAKAKMAKVPVVVHYDHGLTVERCKQALSLGFTSIMFDGSVNDYETNIKQTKAMVEYAHQFGATVEGEIGHVGDATVGDNLAIDRYTTVKEAREFYEATGVDALAIAIGTAHGAYKFKPVLNIKRLKEIKEAINVPLVLHGGSGLSDDDFRNTIANGIAKVNIFTDLCVAGSNAMKVATEQGLDYLKARNLKVQFIKEAIIKKIELFGSKNKA